MLCFPLYIAFSAVHGVFSKSDLSLANIGKMHYLTLEIMLFYKCVPVPIPVCVSFLGSSEVGSLVVVPRMFPLCVAEVFI
jgi:hypothetical protein